MFRGLNNFYPGQPSDRAGVQILPSFLDLSLANELLKKYFRNENTMSNLNIFLLNLKKKIYVKALFSLYHSNIFPS